MAGQVSDKGSIKALDAVTGRATVSSAATYLVLLTAAPSDTTTMAAMTELTTPGSNGYSRQSVTWSAPTTSGTISTSNTAVITFGAFSTNLANVTHCCLVTTSTGTGGDILAYWTLDNARDPASGDSIAFAIGALVLTAE